MICVVHHKYIHILHSNHGINIYEELTADTKLSDYDLDSLDHIELVMDLEEEFDTRLDHFNLLKLMGKEGATLLELVDYINIVCKDF